MSRHPRLTIKSYQSCRADEGDAWSATLYLDGKKVGTARYGGTGGPIDVDFWKKVKGKVVRDTASEKAVKEYCESRPDLVASFDDPKTGKPYVMKADVELVIGEVVEDFLEERQIRRWCRTQVVFKLKGTKEGEFMTLKANWKTQAEQVRAHLAKKYGDRVEEILNERFAA